MQTKLTVRMDSKLIEAAKAYAATEKKSVSKLIADYFYLLQQKKTTKQNTKITKTVQSLDGILAGKNIRGDEYKKHLEDKYL